MIGKLKGIVDTISDDSVILDVGGVGYLVFASTKTLSEMPARGKPAELFIETHVREDMIRLFGFITTREQEWFRILNTVSGVGAKMGLAILSALTPDQIITAVAAQDKKALTAVSGVGNKLAERLLTELKSTVAKEAVPQIISSASGNSKMIVPEGSAALQDAISALVNLGYQRSDAYRAITKIAGENKNSNTSELIRKGLKELTS